MDLTAPFLFLGPCGMSLSFPGAIGTPKIYTCRKQLFSSFDFCLVGNNGNYHVRSFMWSNIRNICWTTFNYCRIHRATFGFWNITLFILQVRTYYQYSGSSSPSESLSDLITSDLPANFLHLSFLLVTSILYQLFLFLSVISHSKLMFVWTVNFTHFVCLRHSFYVLLWVKFRSNSSPTSTHFVTTFVFHIAKSKKNGDCHWFQWKFLWCVSG